MFSGGVESTLRLDLAGAEPAIAVRGVVKGLDMTRLTEFAEQPGAMTGTLNGTFSASGRGTDPAAALSRARGQGSATVTDGTVKGLQLVRPIVLAFGRRAKAPKSVPEAARLPWDEYVRRNRW